MTSIHLLEVSGAPTFTYIVARRLDYCTQEAILSQSAARCSLPNSVKLRLHSLELNLVCFFLATSWWNGLDCNRVFFMEFALKSQALYAGSLWKQWSVCFCLSHNEKRLLLINNSSVGLAWAHPWPVMEMWSVSKTGHNGFKGGRN